jgi:hypothetical protein
MYFSYLLAKMKCQILLQNEKKRKNPIFFYKKKKPILLNNNNIFCTLFEGEIVDIHV